VVGLVILTGAALGGAGGATSEAPTCPGGRPPVRAAAAHTEADHALACTDPQGTWDGPYHEVSRDGRLTVSGVNRAGAPEGVWTFFYGNGAVMKREILRAGTRDGVYSAFYENGTRAAEGAYRDGQPDGLWREWYGDGRLRSQGRFDRGQETGRWTYWFPNGQPDRTGEYRGRRLLPPRQISVPAETGRWTYWYPDGAKRMEGCYRAGERVGEWTEWSETRQVTSRTTYSSAATTGEFSCH